MKITNRFGGKLYLFIALVFLTIIVVVILGVRNGLAKSDNAINYEAISASSQQFKSSVNENENQPNNLPVSLRATGNFKNYRKQFKISKDTTIRIKAVGEAADYESNPFLFNAFDNDGIEIYFDMLNNKSASFDLNKDDRHYRILWKTLQISGQNINKTSIKVKELDSSPTTYTMMITFPWKTLGFITPKEGAKLGFDIAVIDNDEGSMKALYFWHNKSPDAWRNTSTYGTLVLTKTQRLKGTADVGIVSFYHKTGFSENLYPLKYAAIGYVTDSLDLSGKFKAEWDQNNFYLAVHVRDNIKRMANALFDYGWIENNGGKTIWKMDIKDLKYAGGAFKNKCVDTTFRIKKGIYWLNYHTDESHAPGKWDSAAPKTDFYGIQVAID